MSHDVSPLRPKVPFLIELSYFTEDIVKLPEGCNVTICDGALKDVQVISVDTDCTTAHSLRKEEHATLHPPKKAKKKEGPYVKSYYLRLLEIDEYGRDELETYSATLSIRGTQTTMTL